MKKCSKCGKEKSYSKFNRDLKAKSRHASQCKDCSRERLSVYYENNKEVIAKRRFSYYKNNREIIAKKTALYQKKNKEKIKKYRIDNKKEINARQREYYKENKEKYKKYSIDNKEKIKKYHIDNKEKAKKYRIVYRKNNRDKLNSIAAIRRAKKKNAEGSFSSDDIQFLLAEQSNKCLWCGEKLNDYHVDHIISLDKGGSNYPDNICISCPTCNLRKSNKSPIDFAFQMFTGVYHEL